MANKETTRHYSDLHEKGICRLLGARQTSNSGAGKFSKGDCIHQDASLLIECKTVMASKDSINIKKEWLDKNKEEAFGQRMRNNCVAFNFSPNGANYFIINERLMKFLVEKLEEENK